MNKSENILNNHKEEKGIDCFNPINLEENNDSFNFEFKENDILPSHDLEILNEKEFQDIFGNYLDIKQSQLNQVYSNPLYYFKKIIEFYNKSTYLDCYFLKLKNILKDKNAKKKATAKSGKNEGILKIQLTDDEKSAKLISSNNQISIPFEIDDDYLKIKISSFKNNTIEIPLNFEILDDKDKNKKSHINMNRSFNVINEERQENKNNELKNKSFNKENNNNRIIEKKKNITNSSTISEPSNITQTYLSNSFIFNDSDSLSNIQFNQNLNSSPFIIITKENNDKFLEYLNSEKLGGENYESIAIKIFELICNIAIEKIIYVSNANHKNSKKINKFFKLESTKAIDNFQIDAYIPSLTGKELNLIFKKFEKNFFFQKDLSLDENKNYEIIGEIAINILSQAKQKIKQQLNYIHLIKAFNEYKNKDDKLYRNLCDEYNLNPNQNIEKIFILLTDGSYIILKTVIDIIDNNKKDIESLLDSLNSGIVKKPDVKEKLKKYLSNNKVIEALNITINEDKFYNLFLFYYNLKKSGIKFCILFISDIIEDKYENKIEESIKYFLYEDTEKYIRTINNQDVMNLIERFKAKEKTKIELLIINEAIKKYIKKFHQEKYNYFSELELNFNVYIKSNYNNFEVLYNEINKDKNLTQLLFSILKKKIFVNFIFVGFKNINSDKIMRQINSKLKQINFDIIIADDNNILLEKLKVKHESNLININHIFTNIPINIPNKNNYYYNMFNIPGKIFQYNFYR